MFGDDPMFETKFSQENVDLLVSFCLCVDRSNGH